MKRMTYYGVARNAQNKPELVRVTRENGRQVSQEWTGETFKSERKAIEETGRRNAKRLGDSPRPTVETVTLYAKTGRKIRQVTKVTLSAECSVTFTEKLPARLAVPQAVEVCRKRKG